MDKITITLFVHPNSLNSLLSTLKILDGLDIENDYVFQPKDIVYSETTVSNYLQVNIPIYLYITFAYNYLRLENANNG